MPRVFDLQGARAPLSPLAWAGIAFVFWLLVMGALTPGNLGHMLDSGITPDPLWEMARLCAAGALGASVAPLLLLLARHAPIAGPGAGRNLALQATAVLILSVGLICLSCLVAAWASARIVPSLEEVRRQLFANTLLVVLCNGLMLGAMQLVSRWSRTAESDFPRWPDRLTISDRGRLTIVDLGAVEWFESQGNYQEVHANDGVHLYRATSNSLESMLDPKEFVRIHRRYLVARKWIVAVEPMPSGDASVVMKSGARLRQSRQYRRALRDVLRSGSA